MPNALEEGKVVGGVNVGDGGDVGNPKIVRHDSVVINENGENGSGRKRSRRTRRNIEKSKTLRNKMSNNKVKKETADPVIEEKKYVIMPGKPRVGGYVRPKGYIGY